MLKGGYPTCIALFNTLILFIYIITMSDGPDIIGISTVRKKWRGGLATKFFFFQWVFPGFIRLIWHRIETLADFNGLGFNLRVG